MTQPTILITRPLPEALHTAAELREIGVEAIVSPLTEIVPRPEHVDSWLANAAEQPETLIVTSRNGIRAMQHRGDLYALPLWCVGEETTDFARVSGFTNAHCGGQTAQELLSVLKDRLPAAPRALYVSGAMVRLPLEKHLPLQRVIAYENVARPLEPKAEAAFLNGMIHGVMLYSAYAAELYSAAVQKLEAVVAVDGFFISEAVYRNADATLWKNVHIANTPREGALMQLVQQWYSANSRDSGHG